MNEIKKLVPAVKELAKKHNFGFKVSACYDEDMILAHEITFGGNRKFAGRDIWVSEDKFEHEDGRNLIVFEDGEEKSKYLNAEEAGIFLDWFIRNLKEKPAPVAIKNESRHIGFEM